MELIVATKYEQQLKDFKEKRQLQATNGDETLLETSWYNGIMRRNADTLKCGKCKVKDIS
jgi:hypothetical protein